MIAEARFGGVRPVVHVPFGAGDSQPVRHDELAGLVELMLEQRVDGLVALGLASEAWTLTEPERAAVLETVVVAAAGRAPVVAGIEGATQLACERARSARELGAGGLMVLPPPDDGDEEHALAHFAAVGDAAGLPVLVQDSPQVTGVRLSVAGLASLAERHPLVRSVKVEGVDAGPKVSALAREGVEVVAGWGGLHYPESLERGVSGCFPGCDLAAGLLQVHRLHRRHAPDEADARYRELLPLLAVEARSLSHLVLGAKEVLVQCGVLANGAMRAPARSLDDHERRAVLRGLAALRSAEAPGPWDR